ncbi:hypothetical protein [Bradyrhizobium sp. UFLA05-112]
MLTIGISVSSSVLTRFGMLLHPFFVVLLALPALWMVFQVLPIPMRGLGNPIWATASAALNEPLADRITVDIWATVLGLAWYNAIVALGLLTAVVTLDRQRAAHTLYALVSITMCTSALSIWGKTNGLDTLFLGKPIPLLIYSPTAAVLGVLLSLAMAIRTIDQLPRSRQPRRPAGTRTTTLSVAVIAFLICTAAILVRGDSTDVIAAFIGASLLLAIVAIRIWFFGLWGMAGVLATAAVIFVASLTVVPFKWDADLTIALSTQNQAATERMLQDIRPSGSGAGTFKVLLPLYRDIGRTALREQPTAASAVTIEMGRAFLYGMLFVAVIGAFILFKRSLARGHDYVYAALGAAASVSLPIMAFTKTSIFDSGVPFLMAALYGLAFSQSLHGPRREIGSSGSGLSTESNDQPMAARSVFPPSFGSLSARAALLSIGVLLIIQAAAIFSQSLHFDLNVSNMLGTTSSEASLRNGPNTTAITSVPKNDEIGSRLPVAEQYQADETARDHLSTDRPALNVFARRLYYSPLRGDLWLMLAATSQRSRASGYDTAALLKMSYYTAPNEVDLFPLRLSVALGTDAAMKDPEFRDLIRRDLKFVLTRQPALRPAIVAAYRSASADGKRFAENLLSEFDPGYLPNVRGLP